MTHRGRAHSFRTRAFSVAFVAALACTWANRKASAEWFRGAQRLVDTQQPNGSWAGEELYTGYIIPGLVEAYHQSSNTAYKTAAESAGTYIQNNVPLGNRLGEEFYAFQTLSQVAPDPSSNTWRTDIETFYSNVSGAPGGTSAYISYLQGLDEPSNVATHIAHHTLAAHYVDATEKSDWRSGLVDTLSLVDDSSATYPVLALGASLWALAQTGPLDGTLVDPSAPAGSQWDGVALTDLPAELLSHQEPTTGSFYWRFDHAGAPAYGYSEDSLFGTLGIKAAHEAGHGDYFAQVQQGTAVISDGFTDDGSMKTHLWMGGITAHVYAGEALRLALPEPATISLITGGTLLLLARRRRKRRRSA